MSKVISNFKKYSLISIFSSLSLSSINVQASDLGQERLESRSVPCIPQDTQKLANNQDVGINYIFDNNVLNNLNQAPLARPEFSEAIQNLELQKNTLATFGFEDNADNRAVFFATIPELYDRLVNNLHGHKLHLFKTSFQNPETSRIFEALKETTSVKSLILQDTQMKSDHYLSLAYHLRNNRSLKTVDLSGISLVKGAMQALSVALMDQKYLRRLTIKPAINSPYTITAADVQNFYEMVSQNRSLAVVNWPESKDSIAQVKVLANSNSLAALTLASWYKQGTPSISKNSKEAEKYFKKAAELGNWVGYYELGKLSKNDNKIQSAFDNFKLAAEKGYAPAQYQLAEYYRGGWKAPTILDPTPENRKETFRLCKEAADQGYDKAMYRLARLYESGRGVEQSIKQAIQWLEMATKHGNPDAFLALGALYSNPRLDHHNKELGDYNIKMSQRFPKVKGRADLFISNMNK